MARGLSRLLAALALTVTVAPACTPLFVPLVPTDAPAPASRTRLADDSELRLLEGRPRLTLALTTLEPAAHDGDWLAVQWYRPSAQLAASESRWLTAEDVGASLVFDLPPDVSLTAGEWRAVASLGGYVLRQFRVDVAVDPEL